MATATTLTCVEPGMEKRVRHCRAKSSSEMTVNATASMWTDCNRLFIPLTHWNRAEPKLVIIVYGFPKSRELLLPSFSWSFVETRVFSSLLCSNDWSSQSSWQQSVLHFRNASCVVLTNNNSLRDTQQVNARYSVPRCFHVFWKP